MNLGEALLAAVDRFERPDYEPASPVESNRGRTARMRALERAHGGEREAAAAVGVQVRTWRSWKHAGAKLVTASLGKLSRAAAAVYRAMQRAAVRRALRSPGMPIVSAVVRWNGYIVRTNDGYRTVRLDQMTNTDLSHLAGLWADRDTAELAARFEAAVEDAYGDPVEFLGDNVEVRFQ